MKKHIILTVILLILWGACTYPESLIFKQWTIENDEILEDAPNLINRLSNQNILYKGGVIFKGDETEFGGISSIHAIKNGSSILAISDYSSIKNPAKFGVVNRSKWFLIDLQYTNYFLDSAIVNAQGQVHDINGELIRGEIESMAMDNDMIYLSFDERDEILSYNINDHFKRAQKTLKISNFPYRDNAGTEALTLTNNGQLFAIYEKNIGENYCEAWLINPKTNSTKHLKYLRTLNEIKGATTLNNGDIVVMEKTWDKKTSHIKLQLIQSDSWDTNEIETTNILDVNSVALDNFEGITSYMKDGKEYLLLISDDNGDRRLDQRTLLLHFELTLHQK